MRSFTYQLPDEAAFMQTLFSYIQFLDEEHHENLSELLEGASCYFEPTKTPTLERNNELECVFRVEVLMNNLPYFSYIPPYYDHLINIANSLLSPTIGYHLKLNLVPKVMPLIEDPLSSQVSEIISESKSDFFKNTIGLLKINGKEMAEVYLAMYYIEISLRNFIDKIFKKTYGDTYQLSDRISASVNQLVTSRKQKDEKNQWLDKRGDSDLSYTDFSDIHNIISRNWDCFKDYFPDQNWIIGKLDELSMIRNLVAHNSYVSLSGRRAVITYCDLIINQISNGESQ